MAVRNASEPLVRVTLNLYASDYARLQEMYPSNFTTFLRSLLRNYLTRITTQAAEAAETLGDEIVIE